MLGEFLNSEYNNAGELYGLDAVKLSRIAHSASPIEKAQIVKKIAQQGQVQVSRGSRRDMEKHFGVLPNHIKDELGKGNLRLSDYIIYSIKPINSKTIKMFEPQDDKEVGVRNISNAKLPKNMVMVVSGIFLLTGENPDVNNTEARKAIKFESVSTVNAICNGEFSFKANRKQLIPENQAIRCFATDNNNMLPMGYYPLDNPRLVNDDELIEFTIELGTQFKIPENQWLYVGLVGTVTTP
ncbi:MAG: hypothetical protein HYR91_04180 [Flavobacteriia bacterium]|nr:hypothetical protein [Flavobacteriia bacterium]